MNDFDIYDGTKPPKGHALLTEIKEGITEEAMNLIKKCGFTHIKPSSLHEGEIEASMFKEGFGKKRIWKIFKINLGEE